jgi:Ca2+-binding EF-hand superfamily protein
VQDFPTSIQAQLREIDDDGSGIIDEQELTEMAKMYSDMKKAAAEGCIAISTLPKEIQPTLQVFDQDGDGTVAPMELARAAELYQDSKDTVKKLSKAVVGLVIVLVILVTLILIGTAQVIENSKETVTSASGVTTVAGTDQPAASGAVVQEDSLAAARAWSPAQLNGVKSLCARFATAVAPTLLLRAGIALTWRPPHNRLLQLTRRCRNARVAGTSRRTPRSCARLTPSARMARSWRTLSPAGPATPRRASHSTPRVAIQSSSRRPP